MRFFRETSCGSYIGPTEDLGVGTVYLPNANGVGSVVYRGTNFGGRNIIQCRGQAERTVHLRCGPKGGPEWFETHEVSIRTYLSFIRNPSTSEANAEKMGPFGEDWLAAMDPPDCVAPIEAFHFE